MRTRSAEDIKRMLDRQEDFQLVNVLPETYYRKKHIPGSISVPLEDKSFLQRIEHVVEDKDARVVVHCADAECNASSKARAKLEEAGFSHVFDFEGGVEAWEESGYPLEGSESEA